MLEDTVDLRQKHEQLAREHRTIKYNFILTELDLALTFCQMALSSKDQEKSLRNTKNAQRAHEAARHFLQDNFLSESMKATIEKKLADLQGMLRSLELEVAAGKGRVRARQA